MYIYMYIYIYIIYIYNVYIGLTDSISRWQAAQGADGAAR